MLYLTGGILMVYNLSENRLRQGLPAAADGRRGGMEQSRDGPGHRLQEPRALERNAFLLIVR